MGIGVTFQAPEIVLVWSVGILHCLKTDLDPSPKAQPVRRLINVSAVAIVFLKELPYPT